MWYIWNFVRVWYNIIPFTFIESLGFIFKRFWKKYNEKGCSGFKRFDLMFVSKIHFYSLLYYLSYFGNCGIHIKFYQWKENLKENVIQRKSHTKIYLYVGSCSNFLILPSIKLWLHNNRIICITRLVLINQTCRTCLTIFGLENSVKAHTSAIRPLHQVLYSPSVIHFLFQK